MASFTVTCPHCRALLEVDGEKQLVVGGKAHEEPKTGASLEGRFRR